METGQQWCNVSAWRLTGQAQLSKIYPQRAEQAVKMVDMLLYSRKGVLSHDVKFTKFCNDLILLVVVVVVVVVAAAAAAVVVVVLVVLVFLVLVFCLLFLLDRLVGLVIKVSASGAEDPGFESRLWWDFSGSSHTSALKIGTPVATLPGAWRYRVSTGTGRPGVSILWLGEVERLICNFYLSVSARKIVWAGPSLRYTGMLLGR